MPALWQGNVAASSNAASAAPHRLQHPHASAPTNAVPPLLARPAPDYAAQLAALEPAMAEY